MGCFSNKPLENLKKPGTCNHWPVCQARSDGRDSQATDRPAHFLGFPISVPPVHRTGDTNWYGSLYGMTDQSMEHLVEVARSWNHPADLTVGTGPYRFEKYDRSERAYVLQRSEAGDADVHCTLTANEEKPIFNPVLVLRDWGESDAEFKIDGQPAVRGEQFRTGLSRQLDRTDLIVWTQIRSTGRVELVVSRKLSPSSK